MNPENIMLRNKAATKGSVLYNCTSVRSLENSIQIQRQKAEWWLSGAWRAESCRLLGKEFPFCKMKRVLDIGCAILRMHLKLRNCTLNNG